jgi:histidine triad (HIT) family protein
LPSAKIYENDAAIVIADIQPQTPVHLLAMPKRHIASIADITAGDASTIAALINAANSAARDQGIADSGYRLIVNYGPDAGQSVHHLHIHVMGGRQLQLPLA